MKRLLVLGVVLGLASWASAQNSYSLAFDGVATLSVLGDAGNSYISGEGG